MATENDPGITTPPPAQGSDDPVTVRNSPEGPAGDWFGPQGGLESLREGMAAFDQQIAEGRTPSQRRRMEQPPGLGSQQSPATQMLDADELRQSLQGITALLQGLSQRVDGLEGTQQSSSSQMQQGLAMVNQRLQAVESSRSPAGPPTGPPLSTVPGGHAFSFGGVVPPPPPPLMSPATAAPDPLGGGKYMDLKWIPQMPSPPWQSWKSRTSEISGFWSWVDSLSSWLSLLHNAFGPEIKESLSRTAPLYDSQLSTEQVARSQRLMHILRQSFSGFHRVETIVRAFETEQCTGASNGYELIRLLRTEFSIQTRAEAITLKQEFLRTHITRFDHLPDLLRQIDVKLFQFHQLIGTYPRPLEVRDLHVGEADMYLIIMRSLPKDIQEYVKLHAGQTVSELKASLLYHHERTRVVGDLGKIHAVHDDRPGGKDKGKGSKGSKGDKGKGKTGDKGKGKSKSRPSSTDSRKGKGKGKGSRKGSPRASSSDKEQRRKEGLCFECGGKGHLARDCPKKKGSLKCLKCGRPGHTAAQCWSKDAVHAADGNYEESEPEGEERMMMTLTSTVYAEERSHSMSCRSRSESAEGAKTAPPAVDESIAFANETASAWLVDSGATSHIVARRFLKHYTVIQRYPHLKCQLSAANGQEIPNEGIADVEVKFGCVIDGKQTTKPFVLSRTIIAEIPFCVISPFVLLKHGWTVHLGDAVSSYLDGGRSGVKVKIPLSIDKRAWWAIARNHRPGAQGKRRSKSQPVHMDVDSMLHGSTLEDGETQGKQVHVLTEGSQGSEPQSILKKSSETVKTTQHFGGLTFLVRVAVHETEGEDIVKRETEFWETHGTEDEGFETETETDRRNAFSMSSGSVQTSEFCESEGRLGDAETWTFSDSCSDTSEEFFECEDSMEHEAGAGDMETTCLHEGFCEGCETCCNGLVFSGESEMEDQPLPGLDEPVGDSDGDPLVEEPEPDTTGVELYEHIAKGHQPYLSNCMSCVRACGRSPARRLRNTHGPSAVGADFTFLGSLKILVMVVFCSGFLSAFVVSPVNSESNARAVNRALREGGLTGRQLDLHSDGEPTLLALFRTASRMENCPVTGVNFSTFAPERSQANGRVERANQTVKELTAANLFFVESQISRRIPLESSLVPFAVEFACRTYNAFHCKQGSKATVLDRMRGRLSTPKPTTLPFGCLALGKPVSTSAVREEERLTPFVYLGPLLSTGGGCIGIVAKEARLGLSDEEITKVRKFQTARAVVPCQWSVDDLSILCLPAPPDLPPPTEPAVPVNPAEVGPGEAPVAADDRPRKGKAPIVVPVSGPPKEWIVQKGPTPNCYACEQIRRHGKAHGRVHSAACKARYKAWLEQQAEDRERDEAENKRQRVEPQPEVAPPPVLPLPMPPEAGQGVVPQGGQDVEMGGETPDPVPEGDEMEIDALVDQHLCEQEDEFLKRDDPTNIGSQLFVSHSWKLRAATDAAVFWFKTQCLGRTIWQAIPNPMRCELSGQTMVQKDIIAAFEKEFSQLTHLKVGKWITESEAKRLSQASQRKVLATRWVVVQKPSKVRARIVAKDFRACGLSSLREGHYSPTASLEALRLLLSMAEAYQWSLCTLDISTAFLYAELDKEERQPICFPTSTLSATGERLHLLLEKALYGLRRAPLAWYRQLVGALTSLGFKPTSESTVMRFELANTDKFLLVLVYVDDLLITGDHGTIQWATQQLGKRFQTNVTGSLNVGEIGVIEFLGRQIKRDCPKGHITLGLSSSYIDGIEEIMEMNVTPSKAIPRLSELLKKEDHDLDAAQATRYRSALGKLAWFSLTMPHLAYQVSVLSCYQSTPTKVGWLMLVEVVRFAKAYKFYRQVFGSTGPSWYSPDDSRLYAVCDASWKLKSQMGGVILFAGSMVKCYSRRISSTCLSSAESETFSIVEACHESIGIALMAETFLCGLPKRSETGDFVRTSGTMTTLIKTDSEAAKSIGGMFMTLLRRVRHLELRVYRLQELVALGRILLEYIQGAINPSDSLTKDSDQAHMELLLECLGLEEDTKETAKVKTFVEHALEGFGLLSGQNKRRVVSALEKGLSCLGMCNQSSSSVAENVGTGICPDVTELTWPKTVGALPQRAAQPKHVKFSETVETCVFDPSLPACEVENLASFRAIPKSWDRILKRHHVLESLRKPLQMFCRGVEPLVIEICCEHNSGIRQACEHFSLPYLGVTRSVDLSNTCTVQLIKAVLDRKGTVAVWISSPCTAGCRYRFINNRTPAGLQKWKGRYAEHRQIWLSLRKIFEGRTERDQLFVGQEWPTFCDLFACSTYKKTAEIMQLQYRSFVCRTCLDGIFKRWEIRSNSEKLSQYLSTPPCSCSRPNGPRLALKKSGEYSFSVGKFFVAAFLHCMRE